MAHNSMSEFEDWIEENNLPTSIRDYLLENNYDSVQVIMCLTPKVINNFKLTSKERMLLKDAIKYKEVTDDFSVEDSSSETEPIRWKEFGVVKQFIKWEKQYFPVETFSPDGFWAWNSTSKSLLFGKGKPVDVWAKFDDNKPGWLMSPPVLLPSEMGSFKLTFNLRVYKTSDADSPVADIPQLSVCLLNDSYNKRICEFYSFPLKFCLDLKFINITNGMAIGEPHRMKCCFTELFDSENLPIPGNVLALKKPPTILVDVTMS